MTNEECKLAICWLVMLAAGEELFPTEEHIIPQVLVEQFMLRLIQYVILGLMLLPTKQLRMMKFIGVLSKGKIEVI